MKSQMGIAVTVSFEDKFGPLGRIAGGNLGVKLQRRKHHRTTEVGAWLRTVVLGYYQYRAVPGNSTQLRIFSL